MIKALHSQTQLHQLAWLPWELASLPFSAVILWSASHWRVSLLDGEGEEFSIWRNANRIEGSEMNWVWKHVTMPALNGAALAVLVLGFGAFGYGVAKGMSTAVIQAQREEDWNKRGYIKCSKGGGLEMGNIDIEREFGVRPIDLDALRSLMECK